MALLPCFFLAITDALIRIRKVYDESETTVIAWRGRLVV